jgi:hypothetical protein
MVDAVGTTLGGQSRGRTRHGWISLVSQEGALLFAFTGRGGVAAAEGTEATSVEMLELLRTKLRGLSYDAQGQNPRKLFEMHNTDGSGTLSYDEFAATVRQVSAERTGRQAGRQADRCSSNPVKIRCWSTSNAR